MTATRVRDFIGGEWTESGASATHPVHDPATGERIGETPLGGAEEVDAAVRAAREAFPAWRRTPVEERIQPLFRLKALLEERFEDLARTVTRENGKTLPEARGSVRRGIQMIEHACGAPSLMKGEAVEDVAAGIDCVAWRQPLGVFAAIAPFNFPAMVPMWFFPFATACGNTFVLKPSEQVPFSSQLVYELCAEAGFPPGVLNLVNGGRGAVDALITHPLVVGVSFVGSSPVARHVYRTAAAEGKRVQALGGAKNFHIVMPDAKLADTVDALMGSAFGCAGERCLAASVVVAVGEIADPLREALAERCRKLVVGDGARDGVQLGPVISAAALERIQGFIERAAAEGAELVVDGREAELPDRGWFLGATLLDRVRPGMEVAREEIFGPVLSILRVGSLDEALEIAEAHPLANTSSIYTQSGAAAREFRYRIPASMAGVNVGVAAPMSFFGFGGAKGSFFGDLKAHGREAFDFYTDRKVLISRW